MSIRNGACTAIGSIADVQRVVVRQSLQRIITPLAQVLVPIAFEREGVGGDTRNCPSLMFFSRSQTCNYSVCYAITKLTYCIYLVLIDHVYMDKLSTVDIYRIE